MSRLNRVLEIDPAARRCVTEPGVTFAELVRATLAHGLLPMVVPELEGITVDGAPFRVVSYPYTARWPLIPGEHVFEARLPYQPVASKPVRVTVQ